jgi:hypothetical protein
VVPDSFNDLPAAIATTYALLLEGGTVTQGAEVERPTVPMDFK